MNLLFNQSPKVTIENIVTWMYRKYLNNEYYNIEIATEFKTIYYMVLICLLFKYINTLLIINKIVAVFFKSFYEKLKNF